MVKLNASTPAHDALFSQPPESHRELPLVEAEDFLPTISVWTTLGGLFLLLIFVGAFGLIATLKYNVTVKVPVIVRPAGELRLVQAPKEGKVRQIAVSKHQVVKQGDVLVYLDDTRLQIRQRQLQDNLQQLATQQQAIAAQLSSLAGQVAAETERMQRSIAAAQAELRLHQRNYQERQITTVAQVQEAKAALELALEELSRYQQLADSGVVSQFQLREKEAAVKTSQAVLKGAEAGLNPSNAEMAIATAHIAQERAIGEATLARLNQEREQLLKQNSELKTQIQHDLKEIQQIALEKQDTVIRAPASGQIAQLNLRNATQTLSTGETIAQILPTNTPIEIQAAVSSSDIGKVEVGQLVQVKVSACPYPDYGSLKGKVVAIAPDAIASENTNNRPLPTDAKRQVAPTSNHTYEVTIQPESLMLSSGVSKCAIQVGMEGEADIISREETVLKFLMRKARLLADI